MITKSRFENLLTPREKDVFLELVNRGASNREISEQLSIGEKTVKMYLTKIFEKAGIRSRERLIVWWYTGWRSEDER